MIDLLINWLTPTFVSMGASAADVANYLHAVESYIYWGVGALALMIVIMIAVHWLAIKGTRPVIRWTAALAFVTAVVVLVNAVCYGPLNALVSGVLNASKAEISDDVTGNSARVIEKIGEEGMVLVKNDGTLPLNQEKTQNLNVFGWASAHPVFSGTGSAVSGDTAAARVDIISSLNAAGFATHQTLT